MYGSLRILLLTLSPFAALCAQSAPPVERAAEVGALELVPWPREVERLGGTLLRPVRMIADGMPQADRERVDPQLGPGAYRVEIDRDVAITGGDARGLAWARATLFQLARPAGDQLELPRLRISDAPDLAYRGVMLDVARFWHDIEVLRGTVDLLWLLKVPYLHLHLSDDQSFTFPSRTLPKLPSTFADGRRRHYTREELTDLVAYAAARGVTVIPEIDVPGHATPLGRAYPELFGTVDPQTGRARSTGVVNMASERAYRALDGLIGEVCEVFADSPYVHLGADEVAAGGLRRVPEYRDYCEQHDLPRAVGGDVHELFCHFLGRVSEMVRKRGRRPMAWEGFGGTGTPAAPIPRDLVVMAWACTMNPPDRLVAAGFDVVNCGWWPLYLVPPQNRAPGPRAAYAWHPGRFETWESPEPHAILPSDHQHLLGAQLCFWEQTPAVVLPLLRRRLPAISERTWAPDQPRRLDDFERRAAALDARFDQRFAAFEVPADSRPAYYRYRFFPAEARRSWDAMPDFDRLQPARTGTLGRADAERVQAINAAMFVGVEPFGHVETRVPEGWNPYALELTGRLRIPQTGRYEFQLRADDGLAELHLGGERVAWRQRPGSGQHDRTQGELAAGVHEFRLRYFYRVLHNELNLRVQVPGAADPQAFESLLLPLDVPETELAPAPRPFAPVIAPKLRSLATGKPVRVSGGTEGAQLPMLAVDGDPDNGSGWHTHPYPQWLEVDLGEQQTVDRVRVVTYHDGRRHYRYTVAASTDRETWTTVVDRSANTTPARPDGFEDRFDPTAARYLRVNLLFNSANPGVHLNELHVFGAGEPPVGAPASRGEELVVAGKPATTRLPADQPLRLLRFPATLETATTVTGTRLRLIDGGELRYERTAKPANQTLRADVEVRGTVTLRNDNRWIHEAHMLRVEGRLSGAGTLVIAGDGDGGVELRGDSRRSFRGDIRIDGGMLIPRAAANLGPDRTLITMRGGKLFLPGIALRQRLRVVGDATLWLGGGAALLGDIELVDGATLTIDSGGGNPLRLAAAVTGRGTLRISGQPGRATPMTLVAGGGLGDEVVFELAGPDELRLRLGGGNAALGRLRVGTDAVLVAARDRRDIVHFALAEATPWTGSLLIEGFDAREDRLQCRAATAAQLARIGFSEREDGEAVLRSAALRDGELVATERVLPRADLPFAIDPAADRERQQVFAVAGLDRLAGGASPLRRGDCLSFFGDSITWLGGFTGRIEARVAAHGVQVFNRGINGGGVRELRDGSPGAARAGGRTAADGNAPQAAFREVLAADRPVAAVILIGINDVNWRGTTDAEFEAALRQLCREAAAAQVRPVVATLMLGGEHPDGSNPKDADIDRFAAITRRVAAAEGATLVDLRAAVIAWLRNHNRQLQLDGSLRFQRQGLLTYDGIHLSDRGNDLVAEVLADGIHRALQDR